jgi:Cof subfamily protein (haloacid dehalogenase superfamily)
LSIKLIAIDLDGTLLNDKKQITEDNINAINAASKQGVSVVLCTGRPITGIKRYLAQLELNNPNEYAITYNGALAQTLTGETLIKHTLSFEDYLAAEAFSHEVGVHFHVDGKNHIYTANQNISTYTVGESFLVEMGLRYRAVDEMNPELEMPKVMFIDDPAVLGAARDRIFERFADDFSVVQSEPYFVELMPKNVSKGNAVSELANRLGLELDQVMAIGDQGNDLSMIKAAGTGVAMANAIDEVKANAQFITANNNDSGVARAIEKFVLEVGNDHTTNN